MEAFDSNSGLPAEFASASDGDAAAIRQAYQAGYAMVKGKWSKIGPDLREKINLRKAEEQPDGTFNVYGVDIFQENTAKGEEYAYTAEDIESLIQNNQAAIEAGGTPPGITIEHPTKMASALGNPSKAHGRAINFRASPRGNGMIRCDIVRLSPDVASDWKTGRYLGLSAGMVQDADGINKRIGHVALLGGEAPALSNLPMTEIYSACEKDSAVCFSAERVAPPTQQSTNFQPQESSTMDPVQQCIADINAAATAVKAGEDGAQERLKAAQDKLNQVLQLGGEASPAAPAAPAPAGNNMGQYAAEEGGQGPKETSVLPETDLLDDDADQDQSIHVPDACDDSDDWDIEADEKDGYSAMQAEIAQLKRQNALNSKALAVAAAKELRTQFSAEVEGLINAGHMINAEDAKNMFKALADNPKGLAAYRQTLKNSPKKSEVALTAGQTFSAEGRNGEAKDNFAAEKVLIASHLKGLGVEVSEEDFAVADAFSAQPADDHKLA